ncbi:MAG: hypothetical protein RDU20_10170 [Desulfomonilaceae bacterium]|nr:hypothetical protein [Desulfomonilaceae bacterium]
MQMRVIVTILLVSAVVSAFLTASWASAVKASGANANHINVNVVPPNSGTASATDPAQVTPPAWNAQAPQAGATTVTTCYQVWGPPAYAQTDSWNVPAAAGARQVRSAGQTPLQQGRVGQAAGHWPMTPQSGYTPSVQCYTCVPTTVHAGTGWDVPATAAGLPPAAPYPVPARPQTGPSPGTQIQPGPVSVQQPQAATSTVACLDPVRWIGSWWRSLTSGTRCVNYACVPLCY